MTAYGTAVSRLLLVSSLPLGNSHTRAVRSSALTVASRSSVELGDLLAVFLALVRGAAPLREHARQSRDEYENEAGRERCDYRLVPAPTPRTLCAGCWPRLDRFVGKESA